MARAGSASEDLAGAARIAPLVYCYQDDLDRLLKASDSRRASPTARPRWSPCGVFRPHRLVCARRPAADPLKP